MKFELKRIIYTWKFLIIIACIVASLLLGIAYIRDPDDDFKTYDQMKKHPLITNDSVEDYLSQCQKLSQDQVVLKLESSFPQYCRLIIKIYNTIDPSELGCKSDFFADRVQAIEKAANSRHIYSNKELQRVTVLARKTSVPFKNGFADHWGEVYGILTVTGVVFAIAALLFGVDFTSKDKILSMDKILYSMGTNTVFRLGCRRILSGIIVISTGYAALMVCLLLGNFGNLKYATFGSPAMMIEPLSIYQDSLGGLFVKSIFAGIFAAVYFYLLAILINLVTENRTRSLVISMILFVFPLVVNTSRHLPSVVSRITSVLPCMAYVVRSDLRMYHTYGSLTVYDMILIVSIVGSGILAVLDLYLYRRKALNR